MMKYATLFLILGLFQLPAMALSDPYGCARFDSEEYNESVSLYFDAIKQGNMPEEAKYLEPGSEEMLEIIKMREAIDNDTALTDNQRARKMELFRSYADDQLQVRYAKLAEYIKVNTVDYEDFDACMTIKFSNN